MAGSLAGKSSTVFLLLFLVFWVSGIEFMISCLPGSCCVTVLVEQPCPLCVAARGGFGAAAAELRVAATGPSLAEPCDHMAPAGEVGARATAEARSVPLLPSLQEAVLAAVV